MILPTLELEGILQPDGSLILDEKPILPPGRVRVALQPLPESPTGAARMPDAPWLDDSISSPL
jgi:hypothetical protein